MGKNVKLANIYIKIYNKCPLTMDDLAFLAKYDPECFEKTCHNLVYNVPETKKLMNPKNDAEPQKKATPQNGKVSRNNAILQNGKAPQKNAALRNGETPQDNAVPQSGEVPQKNAALQNGGVAQNTAVTNSTAEDDTESTSKIRALLENLKSMEVGQFDIQKLNADNVKQLLGSLYMELLFPHNDRDKSFEMGSSEDYSTFNKKA